MIAIIETPTTQQKEIIRAWLKAEYAETGDGFFVNWEIIEPCFVQGRVHCLTVDGKPVAFSMFNCVYISVIEVQPKFRGNSYGRVLVEHLFRVFVSRGATEILVQCEPKESAGFWQKMGFVNYKKESGRTYMRFLL